jgi:hypothetical protein
MMNKFKKWIEKMANRYLHEFGFFFSHRSAEIYNGVVTISGQ